MGALLSGVKKSVAQRAGFPTPAPRRSVPPRDFELMRQLLYLYRGPLPEMPVNILL